jgi:hypothetical protein
MLSQTIKMDKNIIRHTTQFTMFTKFNKVPQATCFDLPWESSSGQYIRFFKTHEMWACLIDPIWLTLKF